jgi:HlyD family secretion protein
MPRSLARQARRTSTLLIAGVTLATAACCPSDEDLHLVGTVERTLLELVAPASETIRSVHAERGQRVEADAILVELDPTLAEAEVARAEANLAGARTAATLAQRDLERADKLRKRGVSSEQDLERAELARDEARAGLRASQAALAAARKRQADLTIRAPNSGILDQIPFDTGERVPAGAVVAVVLKDGDPWVRVWIPESAFARVGPGAPAEVTIDGVPGTLRASVLDVAREPEFTPHYALTERDRVHLVYETRVGIGDPVPGLRPGAPAEVIIHPNRGRDTAIVERR